MRRRGILGQHRVQRLPRSQRVLRRQDRRQHVTAFGDLRVRLAVQAERDEPVLLLKCPDARHVVRAADEGTTENEDPGAGRLLHMPHPGGKLSLPVRADEGEAARTGPRGALTDVVEVVGGDPDELEGEVAIAHVRM